MKKTALILIIGILSVLQTKAQCPAGDLIIQNQAQVNYFVDQCPDVDTIQGSLIIGDLNSDITDISGLLSIRVITGGFTAQHNNSLTSLKGLDSIISIGGWLTISKNQQLTSLEHLEGITTVQGAISINKNDQLVDLSGLENVSAFDGDLIISDNAKLTSLAGLASIQNAIGSVRIQDNPLLPNLSGLNILKTIEGDLTIQSNDALKNLDGLDSLASIGNHCSISYNSSLADLDAFANLTSIGADLFLGSNTSLSDCTGICELINNNGVGGSIAIGDNLSNCLNNSVLIPFCQMVPTYSAVRPEIAIFPNPAHQYLKLSNQFSQEVQKLTIYSLTGKQILSKKNKNNLLDISELSVGMYILAVHTKNQVYYQKFVVK